MVDIYLKYPKKVFPNKYTRISPHDLALISHKKQKWLTKSERNYMEHLSDQTEGGLISSSDLIVERLKNKLKIRRF